jgi:hypothetical protein
LDGPILSDGTPTTIEVTLDTLRQKINATDFPFGHGYVVAALLLGISPEEYTMPSAQDIQRVVIPEEEEILEEKESDVGATAAPATAAVTAAPAVVAPIKSIPKLSGLRKIGPPVQPITITKAAAEP